MNATSVDLLRVKYAIEPGANVSSFHSSKPHFSRADIADWTAWKGSGDESTGNNIREKEMMSKAAYENQCNICKTNTLTEFHGVSCTMFISNLVLQKRRRMSCFIEEVACRQTIRPILTAAGAPHTEKSTAAKHY